MGCTSATFELFWASGTQSGMSSSKRVQMPFDNADESWQYIVFNMSGNGEWAGKLNALRFDYELQAEGPGETMYISSILFARTADAARRMDGCYGSVPTPEGMIHVEKKAK